MSIPFWSATGSLITDWELLVLGQVDLLNGYANRRGLLDQMSTPFCLVFEAVESCFRKGWIREMTRADRKRDAKRWKDNPNQVWTEWTYQKGAVDFTDLGWKVYVREIRLEYGPEEAHKILFEHCYYKWEVPGLLTILSTRLEQVLKDTTEIQSGTDTMCGGHPLRASHRILRIDGPVDIGPWWVKRLQQARTGYRLDVWFEPDDCRGHLI